MAYEYAFRLAPGQTLKMRRFTAGGSKTANTAGAFVAASALSNYGTDGAIALTEVSTGQYANAADLASAVADDEFGYAYVGAPVEGQMVSDAEVPTGAGGSSGGGGAIVSQVTASAVSGSIPFVNLVAKRTEAHQYIITVTDLDGAAVSFSGKTIKAVASLYDGTFAFQAAATVSGTGNNVLTFTFTTGNLATARKYKLDVWNTTDNSAAVEGILWVKPAVAAQ